MTRSGQDPRRGPPEAPASAGIRDAGRRSQVSGRDGHRALRLTGLALLGHMLRSRGFYERVVFAAIVLAALAGMGKDNHTRSLARLAAWNRRRVQFLERKARTALIPENKTPDLRLHGGARRDSNPQPLIRRFPCGHPDPFRTVRDL